MSEIQDQLQLQPVTIEVKKQEEPQQIFEDQQKRKEEHDRLQEQKNLQTTEKSEGAQAPIEERKQSRVAQLKGFITEVNKNMPPVYPGSGQADQVQKKNPVYKSKRQQLPFSFKGVLDEIMLWEDVKEESSAPVQRAATALREAETDAEAAAAMGDLMAASLNYLKKRSGYRIRGWGRDRQKLVKKALDAIQSFVVSGQSVYATALEDAMNAHKDKKGLPQNYQEYRQRLNSAVQKAAGYDDLGAFANARAEKEAQAKHIEGISIVDMAADRLAQRATPSYLRQRSIARPEQDLTTEQVRQKVNSLVIPNVALMNFDELMEDTTLESMRAEVLEPLQEVLDRHIAFGHFTDVDEIHKLRARVDTLRQELDMYDLKLSLIAGDENAVKKYNDNAFVEKSVEEVEAEKLAKIKKDADDDLAESVRWLNILDGRSLSKSQKKQRALIIEQRKAKRDYFNNGQETINRSKKVTSAAYLSADNQVQLEREIALVCGLTMSEYVVRKETEDGKKTEFVREKWTDDKYRELLNGAASEKKDVKLKSYRMMVDNILNMDISIFDKTQTEEDIFSHFSEKIVLLQLFSQLKAFASEVEKLQDGMDAKKYKGIYITAEEINRIRVLGEFGESLNATIGFTQDAMKDKESVLVTYEDIMAIRDKERRKIFLESGLGEDEGLTKDEERINEITAGYSVIAPETLEYKPGCDTKQMKLEGMFRSHYSGITVVLNDIHKAYETVKNKEYTWEKITGNKYSGKNAAKKKQHDMNELLKRIGKASVEDIHKLDRLNVKFIGTYWNANQACDEVETFAAQHQLTLSEENKQTISKYRAFHNKYFDYLVAYGELLLEPGLRSLDAKGFRLEKTTLAPGMSRESLEKFRKNLVSTPEEKKAYDKWVALWEKWKGITFGDGKAFDMVLKSKFGEGIDKSNMSVAEQADYAITSGQAVYDAFSNYTSGRQQKDGIQFKGGEISRKTNTVLSSMIVLNKIDKEKGYEMFKALMTGTDEKDGATVEATTAKARAFELIFDEINSWDMSEFNFTNQKELLENAEIKMTKLRMVFEFYETSREYDSILKSGKVEGLKYTEEDMIKLRARIKAMQQFKNLMMVGYELIRNPVHGTEYGNKLAKTTMVDLINGMAERRAKGDTAAQSHYAQTVIQMKQTNLAFFGAEEVTSLDANAVLEKNMLEAEKEIKALRNKNK